MTYSEATMSSITYLHPDDIEPSATGQTNGAPDLILNDLGQVDVGIISISIFPETESFRTSDGVRLDADVYRPSTPGPHPVLLLRQAYGRKVASTLCYAHPAWYAAQGYIVVVQDVRGRGTSEGVFKTFEHEADDGAETIAWAAGLEGCNGAVGMYGFSYQGMVQLLAAARPTPALKAVAPAMIGWNVHDDWAYENGAFHLAANLGWAMQLAAETARLTGRLDAFEDLYALSRAGVPMTLPNPSRPAFMERWRELSHYHDWLDRPAGDAYWDCISPSAQVEALAARGLPALFIGGWFDSHFSGTLAAFKALAERSAAPQRLVVGPWAHFPWDRRCGELDFGPAAVTRIDQLQVRWFDHWLKGRDTGLLAEPAVQLFDMGDGVADAARWRGFEAWPRAESILHLAGDGRAALAQDSGRLAPDPPTPGAEALVHDPWRPAPSFGGAFGAPNGPLNRAVVDARPDVMTFTGAPLGAPLVLAGDVEARLRVATEAKSFDLKAVLSRVTSEGRVYPLAEGFITVAEAQGPAAEIVLPMRATCASLQAGEALRLSLSAAAYPAHPVNPGSGARPADATLAEAQVITLNILTGPDGSRLALPTTEEIAA